MTDRFVQAHLVDAAHLLPMPSSPRLFSQTDEGETIDRFDAFWAGLLADGSLALGPRPAAPAPEASAPSPAPAPAPSA